MKRKIVIGFKIFAVFLIFILLNGCTAIGFGIGYYIDMQAKGIDIPFHSGLDSLDFKDEIQITLQDGSIKQGKFCGLSAVSDEEFLNYYPEIRTEDLRGFSLPEIGDTLTIYLKPAESQESEPLLFDRFTLRSFESGNHTYLKVRYFSDVAAETINLNQIHKITDQSGNDIDIDDLNSFIHEGGLNSVTCLNLTDKYTRQKIRVVDIQNIRLFPKQNAVTNYTGIGLVLDLVIWAL